jgi:hypothetical protein
VATQTRFPTSDKTIFNWTPYPSSPTTRWDKVDEDPSDDDTSYIYNTVASQSCYFGFTPFSVPPGSTINYLRISYRHKKIAGGTCNIRSALQIGEIYPINSVDPGVNPTNGTWNTRTYDYTTNPHTGLPWTVDDINGLGGAGGNGLTAFGLWSTDATPNPYCTQVYAVVDYTAAQIYDETGKLQVILAAQGGSDAQTMGETAKAQTILVAQGELDGFLFNETGLTQVILALQGKTDQAVLGETGKLALVLATQGRADTMQMSETAKLEVVLAVQGHLDIQSMTETAKAQIILAAQGGQDVMALPELGREQVILALQGHQDTQNMAEGGKETIILVVLGEFDELIPLPGQSLGSAPLATKLMEIGAI